MEKWTVPYSGLEAGPVALGCMRMSSLDTTEAERVIKTSLEAGINVFDHADIYGGGEAERVFGRAVPLHGSQRENMIIQSKCGIREGFFDFSEEHILSSVDAVLQRLGTDYLDVLLLHRPDVLMEPEETGRAFDQLFQSGKVRNVGVSNMNPGQIRLLQSGMDRPIAVNQMQLSLLHTPMIDAGLQVNMHWDGAVQRDGGTLEYMREQDMTLQAWSPFQHGMIEGPFIDQPAFPEINKALSDMAEKYNTSKEAVAAAWILRLPMKAQTVIGSMNTSRIQRTAEAAQITLTRKDWYMLYQAAGNKLP
ncbi:aldo/keto reductase [Alkalicoccus chagannorensis]|uniref:aldo/keto reductase n=1 Tax=Alkalicoccus chagannorensis TaxID=427072 RepID=UPI00041139D7|nr:aldo/keto reductase [Alkalicoccus chagannorensis]